MANNRIWIKCVICDESILIAKYYPRESWYVFHNQFEDKLTAFFNAHQHRDEITDLMWGTHIRSGMDIEE